MGSEGGAGAAEGEGGGGRGGGEEVAKTGRVCSPVDVDCDGGDDGRVGDSHGRKKVVLAGVGATGGSMKDVFALDDDGNGDAKSPSSMTAD